MAQKEQIKPRAIATTDLDGSLSKKIDEINAVLNTKQDVINVNTSILLRSLVNSYYKWLMKHDPKEVNLNELF